MINRFEAQRKPIAHRLALAAEARRRQHGFTLVELLVVVAIIGVLVMTATPVFHTLKNRVLGVRAAAEIRGVQNDIGAYAVDNNTLPDSLAAIGKGDMRDPFGTLYQYLKIELDPAARRKIFGVGLNQDYDFYSKGRDLTSALSIMDPVSLDDIIRAGDGGYLGEAARY